MVKKEDEKSESSFLKNMGLDFVYNASRNLFDSLIDTVQESLYNFTRKLAHFAISYVLFLAGLILVLLSIIILLYEYAIIHYGWSTLIFGVVFILIAFIMRVNIKKGR